jgi:hypothetical protein
MGTNTTCWVDVTTGSYFTSPLLKDDNSDTPPRAKAYWSTISGVFIGVGALMIIMGCITHICLKRYIKVLMDTRQRRHQFHTSLITFLFGLIQAHQRHHHDDDNRLVSSSLTHLVNDELYDPRLVSLISSFAYGDIADAHEYRHQSSTLPPPTASISIPMATIAGTPLFKPQHYIFR